MGLIFLEILLRCLLFESWMLSFFSDLKLKLEDRPTKQAISFLIRIRKCWSHLRFSKPSTSGNLRFYFFLFSVENVQVAMLHCITGCECVDRKNQRNASLQSKNEVDASFIEHYYIVFNLKWLVNFTSARCTIASHLIRLDIVQAQWSKMHKA